MRWIIGIAIALMLGIGLWFWYPRLMEDEQASPSTLLPESTWAIYPLNDGADKAILTDSLSTFRFILKDEMVRLVEALPADGRYWFYLYGEPNAGAWGLLSEQELTEIPALAPLAHYKAFPDYYRYQQDSSAVGLADPSKVDALLELESATESYLYLRPKSLLEREFLNTSDALSVMLASNFDTDGWLAMELTEENGLFRMMGVEKRTEDTTTEKAVSSFKTNLLNYLPAQSGAGIIELHDSSAVATAYCPYQLDDTISDQNLFIFVEHQNNVEAKLQTFQDYQTVPIAVQSPDSALLRIKPGWIDQAYAAQLSAHIVVYGASFEAISSVIDDFLADDRLINSPYYQPLEPYISDASFTLFLRPDILRISDAYVLETTVEAPINTLIYQSFEELPLQQFHALSILHDKQIKDLAPIAWSVVLDTTVARGPWEFKNHYNGEPEILVQDALEQLYLINKDGRILWKRKFKGLINDEVKMIDGFENNKKQMVFTTPEGLHFVDRNGNEVDGFPIGFYHPCNAAPLCVRYNDQGDYRLITNSGGELVNYSLEGKEVSGWNRTKIEKGLDGSVKYLRYGGKDYLVAMDISHRVHILDRAGNVRKKAFDIDSNVYEISLVRGPQLADCRMIGHDSLGNLYSYDLNGKSSNENLLPVGGDVGLSTTNKNEFRYITNKDDRVIALDKQRDVSLDYLMPEPLSSKIFTLGKDEDWIGLENEEQTSFYILDLNGRLLDKMPLSGQGPALLIDLDQNGSLECVLPSQSKGLVAYKLAD